MIEDSPANFGCLINLEGAVNDLRSQHKATHTVLKDILSRLGPVQAQNMPNPPVQQPTPSPAPSVGQKRNFLKPATPSDFTGDCSTGKSFLISCQMYIRLCPKVFDDDAMQIVWAMSYMKTGCAAQWAVREFELKAKEGHLCFVDRLDFKEEFRKDFTPLDAESTAINMLETTSYFQGKQTVDEYLDQFHDLIYDSGYTDKKTIIVKFHCGLDCQITSALAGMASSCPSDTNSEAWFKLAIQMDQNHTADEAFQASHRQTPMAPSHLSVNSRPQPIAGPIALPVCFTHSNLSPGNPVPIDIDAAHKTKAISDNCRCCGKTGHWVRDCDLCFDVHYMDADELELPLEDKLAAKDAVPAKTPAEEEPVSVEDFVSHSG